MMGLICETDEMALHRGSKTPHRVAQKQQLVSKCGQQKRWFFRKQCGPCPLKVNGSSVEIFQSKFLRVHWEPHMDPQHQNLSQESPASPLPAVTTLILTTFYRGTAEGILNSCIMAWFGNHTRQRGQPKWSSDSLSLPTRYTHKATNIVNDPTHPYHTLLPSGKRFYGIQAFTVRMRERK